MLVCHRFLAVLSMFAVIGLQAEVRASALVTDNGEVLVEWDLSRRSPIQGAPFSRQVAPDTSSRVTGAGDLVTLKELDQAERTWTVQFSDATVRRMLQRWAADAGYQLLWDVPRDFPIEVEMKLSGKFRDVVWLVVKSLAETDAPVQASINMDVRLVRVVRYLNGQAR